MDRRIALPFLTLSDSAVIATPWKLSLNGGEWLSIDEYLADWDPSCTIRLRRSVRLAPEVAATELAIPLDELCVAITVRLGSGQGRLPRIVLYRDYRVLGECSWTSEFQFDIPGQYLSMVLDLLTVVTLSASPSSSAPLSPRNPGDRLWSESSRVRLEGVEPRFPIETADIARLLGNAMAGAAPWHLHWSPRDWDRDFHGSVRLYLNEKAKDFLARIEMNDGITQQMLLADIMSQICERFILDYEEDLVPEDLEPGSLGMLASTWLRNAWPGKDPVFIRSVLESRPGIFRSTFLALAEPQEM